MSRHTAQLGQTPFTVVDVETTGINPSAHDRIIEIGIVKVSALGEIEEEYATLVNPRRDVGRQDIHRIHAGDILTAPEFAEIAADVGSFLCGSIVVGHNLRFDLSFIASEFSRIGITMPEFPSICTLALTYEVLPEIPSRKLARCCEAAGIRHEFEHSALGDARATAALLVYYLEQAKKLGRDRQIFTSLESTPLSEPTWFPRTSPGRTCSRNEALKRQSTERRYLARLVERMLGDDATDKTAAEYLLLLDRALEDRQISRAEAESLVAAAVGLRMTRSKVLDAHRSYLASLASEAVSDGVITSSERVDLESVCDMLDLNHAALDEILAAPQRGARIQTEDFKGKSVCFTGEFIGSINGERITRGKAQALASAAGLYVQPGVTRKLDLLVVADANSQSGKAAKARGYGIRVVAEVAFWKALHVKVD